VTRVRVELDGTPMGGVAEGCGADRPRRPSLYRFAEEQARPVLLAQPASTPTSPRVRSSPRQNLRFDDR